ncbi:polysaccharide deacetylase family sporulation protein PdaB, partial [Mesorhizobium sp. M00.F.Ca.ET.186.01.1.1]
MKFIYVVSAQRLKQILIIAAAILLTAGIGYAERDTIAAFSSNGNKQDPQAIYKVDTKDKKIALTFDISWGETRALPILDVLKEKNVNKATLFLSSPWSQRHPEIVKRIKEDGLEIGSHGHKHDNY